jgi:hypothetical protein
VGLLPRNLPTRPIRWSKGPIDLSDPTVRGKNLRQVFMIRGLGIPACLVFPASLAIVGPLGCDRPTDHLPREAVSGRVTLDGMPLASGSISFYPESPDQPDRVSGSAPISDGTYSLARLRGLTPGTYRVSIISSGAVRADATPGPSPKAVAPVPADERSERESTLRLEVEKGGSNRREFALTDR